MSLQTDVATAVAALAAVETDVNNQTATPADNVLAAVVPVVSANLVEVFGADPLVTALQEAGYTVTPPAAPTDPNATDAGTSIPVTVD